MRAIVGVVLGAFLFGAAASWFLFGSDTLAPGEIFQASQAPTGAETNPVEPSPAAADAPPASPVEPVPLRSVEQVVEQQGGLDQRIAAMEQRLARLDLQAEAAAGNAARAEGLLIAFATRRAIERGAPLGYLADQLRLRFGDSRPNAVQTVIEASRDPVTLDQLIARLEGLAPQLRGTAPGEGGLTWLSREVRELFVVRRESAPSPATAQRLRRAQLFLESGRAGSAASEIRNLPNAVVAEDWIGDAERYATVQRSLELLELTAILEPRELRDGAGARVEQPSPTGATDGARP